MAGEMAGIEKHFYKIANLDTFNVAGIYYRKPAICE